MKVKLICGTRHLPNPVAVHLTDECGAAVSDAEMVAVASRYNLDADAVRNAAKARAAVISLCSPLSLLVHGDANGVDRIASDVWFEGDNPQIPMPAMWDRDGKKAGPRRNERMRDILVAMRACGHSVEAHAFPCPKSRGTWHMVHIAEQAGIPTTVHRVFWMAHERRA